jgi:hypothetical protein
MGGVDLSKLIRAQGGGVILGVKDRKPSDAERTSVLRGLYSASAKAPGDLGMPERMKLAKEGKALPDGSFPIRNMNDLTEHALPSFGRSGNKTAAKAHILKRARALGAPSDVIKRVEGYGT